ncbi:hypothetical protein [Nonomuraea sp. NPDC023979]|uniref:hypothetical protein n=1 Tax=Nonomuraea sp. NPDC023979 TaxID=3154796 RepID=UPI0033ED5DA9
MTTDGGARMEDREELTQRLQESLESFDSVVAARAEEIARAAASHFRPDRK